MGKTNEDANPTQGAGLAAAQALFADYKKKDEDKPKKLSKEEILARYFVPRKSKEIFRILPPLDGRDHIEKAYFHVVPMTVAGGETRYKKVYCPKSNNPKVPKKDANGEVVTGSDGKPFMVADKCPICEKSEAMLAKQDQSVRKIKNPTEEQQKIIDNNKEIWRAATKYEAKLFYIVRGIDRNKTGDGVKYWRFKHNFKSQGDYDKLIPALEIFVEQNQVDFADPYKGTDLIISVVDNQMNNGRTYRAVSNITARGSSKLSEDELVMQEWLNDKSTWRDVFKEASAPHMTSYEVLDRIAKGTNPYWDDSDPENKKWVYPDPRDAEKQEKANNRDQSLGSTVGERKVKHASDLVNKSYDGSTTIENVTKEDVGEFEDDAEELTGTSDETHSQPEQEQEEPEYADADDGDDDEIDDLPF